MDHNDRESDPDGDRDERDHPVLRTPRGASPRGLRSDSFESKSRVFRPAAESVMAPSPGAGEAGRDLRSAPEADGSVPRDTEAERARRTPSALRTWDFSMPDPLPARREDQMVDEDANRRRAGLRAPKEPAELPDAFREKISGNWERIASEPPRSRRQRLKRNPREESVFLRWLYPGGRFDIGTLLGPLLLLAFLTAMVVYGWRLLAPR